MDRARAPGRLVRPRHAALDRQVDLEGAGPVPVAAVGARDPRRAAARRRCRRPRRGARSSSDDVGVAAARRASRRATPVSIVPPCSRSAGGEGVGDRARAALRDRPAVGVAGADQRHPDRRAHRPVERRERVRGDAAEERPRLRRAPRCGRAAVAGSAAPAARSAPGGSGGCGTWSTGRIRSSVERVEATSPAAPKTRRQARAVGAQPGGGLLDRAQQHAGACRRRADGRGRPPASTTRGRGARGRASAGTASPPPSGGRPSSGRAAGPGRSARCVRVPPPISSAASSTVTSTPSRASADRAGQPVRAGADDDRRRSRRASAE